MTLQQAPFRLLCGMQGAATIALANLNPHWSECVHVYVSPNKIQL
jgi:hypothetical protein